MTSKSSTSKSLPLSTSVLWPAGFDQNSHRRALLAWGQVHGRHDLPWSGPDPSGYRTLVSEIMMQQTTVAVGRVRFPAWMSRFPDWASLASADMDQIMKAWEGLGYYARARALHACAIRVVSDFGGTLPSRRADRLSLPGVGPSTASALGSFVFGHREAIFDGNVNRVYRRWWGDRWPDLTGKALQGWQAAMTESVMPTSKQAVRGWSQSIMDLGATVCTPRKPNCGQCPWQTTCAAHQSGTPENWPPKSRKPAVQELLKKWLWVVDEEGRVAVHKPTDKGVWSGLWMLPIDSSSLDSSFLRASGDDRDEPVASGRHVLSHRLVVWSVHRAPASALAVNGDSPPPEWLSESDWCNKALPAPLRAWWLSLTAQQRDELFHPSSQFF